MSGCMGGYPGDPHPLRGKGEEEGGRIVGGDSWEGSLSNIQSE